MEKIFHEKQEGSLCAQHCLNNLLQGSFFTAVDLAELATQLDETERATMAEGGATEEYRQFIAQPSSNFDDSGYFSIQVLQTALRVWGLELLNFTSSDVIAMQARDDPRLQRAYVCNFKDHWFSIRKIGNQWFNLNSLLSSPELISDTYLSLFLTQLQQEGYSIFLVLGELAETEADQLLRLIPAVQPIKPHLITDTSTSASSVSGQPSSEAFGEEDLAQALAESKRLAEQEDESLQRALALSAAELAGPSSGSCSGSHRLTTSSSYQHQAPPNPANIINPSASEQLSAPSAEELRNKRLEFYSKQEGQQADNEETSSSQVPAPPQPPPGDGEMTEEAMLEAAIAMSMQAS